MQVKGGDATPMKRRVFELFRALAERCEPEAQPTARRSRWSSGSGWRPARSFVYGPVRDQLGLRNARWCYTGGAPLGPDTYRFFRSFGINLKQVYGATEARR
jgi:long-chain acyl-CoA synthetase